MNISKWKMVDITKEKFRSSTLNFIFIIAYVNIFQRILGAENSIVGVIFTIMMSASMVRDLTATPLKNLFTQALVLVWMAIAAFLVTTLSAPLAFLINFITILMILYAFTYEYSDHIYFPYILSYLFLIFISPINASQLPGRILGMLIGAVSIILYQLVMGRKRVVETARDVLSEMIDEISQYISYVMKEQEERPDLSDMHHKLCQLSQTVYQRRKKALCVSDASFSMVAAGRGLEHLLILVHELPGDLSENDKKLLENILSRLKVFRSFLQQEVTELPPLGEAGLFSADNEKASGLIYKSLVYIHDRLLHMTDPQRKTRYRKTVLSLKVRFLSALDFSPVRAVYALRVALLLSCATLLVQLLGLPHGKWLLFTMASVSLPYADDVPQKIKKRLLATVFGGLAGVVIYGLVPSAAGRTAAMMLSGYLSFYFTDYVGTFACSTIGALGGAVFMNAFGLGAVGSMFLTRLGYILAGAATAYIFNCLVCPYKRAKATRLLWEKYKAVAGLLTKVCQADQTDPQLYYSLVIQAYMQEEKLTENADLDEWEEFPELLPKYREQVRMAHRKHAVERADAPAFEAGHLS